MASLNFNPSNQTFHQLMGNGLADKVPPFQRDDSWDSDDWKWLAGTIKKQIKGAAR